MSKEEIKKLFEEYYDAWSEHVTDMMETETSSFSHTYVDHPTYQKITQLGKEVLPYIMEKLENYEFLLNSAVFEIANLELKDVIPDPTEFYSEQEISEFLLDWWKKQTA